jgi:DNA polymerase-3 subunit alpha
MRNKAGDTVAFLTLDDRSGRFEIRLFAKEYERFRDILQKDQIVIVDCTVSMDDYSGGMQGRGKEVMTLEQARQRRARSITLSLRSDALAEGFSEHLAQVLESYRLDSGAQPQSATAKLAATASYTDDRQEGSLGCGITISYQREAAKGCIMLSDEWRVAPSNELVQRLRSEYGRANVVVDY